MQGLLLDPTTMWPAIIGVRCSIEGNRAKWVAGRPGWCRGVAVKTVGRLDGAENACFQRYQFFKINFVKGWPNPSP